ncbi:hypothetical protein PENTCL1PPCAC_7481, partial [Pristionchus entomophagus]
NFSASFVVGANTQLYTVGEAMQVQFIPPATNVSVGGWSLARSSARRTASCVLRRNATTEFAVRI